MSLALKWAVGVIGVLTVLYGLIIVGLYTQQRRLIFFPPNIYMTPEGVGLDAREIVFAETSTTPDLTGWWIEPIDNQPVIVFFHGNASAIYSHYDIFKDLAAQGYGVLSVGYPGYPGSGGTPSEASLVASAQKHIDFLTALGIKRNQIVYMGTSLGSGVAAQLTVTHPPSLLILDAPFYSMSDMAQIKLKLPGLKRFVKDSFQSHKALRNSTFPILILHGTQDNIIPYTQSEKLFEALPEPKSRHVIEGGGHTNLWGLGGRALIIQAIEDRI